MRKLISRTTFLIIILLIIVIKGNNIVAIDEFPSTIQVTVNNSGYDGNASLINYGYGSLYKKVYTAPDIGTYGKSFCTTFQNYAPGAGQSFIACGNPKTCDATTFTKGKSADEEKRAAIGVGAIIKKARDLSNGGGGINGWDYYYYAELAINRFLYIKYGQSVNNVSDISKLNSTFKKMLTAANEAYTEYNKDQIDMTDLKEKNGVIETEITCKNSQGKEAECNNLSTLVKVKANGNANENILSDNRLSRTKNGKKVILRVDLSDYSIESTLNVSVTATNKKTYYMAKNYTCGTCAGRPFQNMTPNLIKPISTQKPVTKEIEINSSNPNKGCSEALEDAKQITGNTFHYTGLQNLYNTYKLGNLLNVQDPSCSNPKSEGNMSCKKTTFNVNFNHEFTTNENTKLMGYCTLNYILDSSIFSDAVSKSGGILYESTDGVAAIANVKYSCVVPYQDTEINQQINLEIDKSQIVPKLSILVGNVETAFSYKLAKTGRANYTSFDGNKIKISTNLKNSGYVIWDFQGDITYYYDKKLSVNKDNSSEIKLGGCNGDENCMELNYGIIAPNNNAGEYTSTLKLNTKDTLYQQGNLNSETTCDYELTDTKNENSFNYRAIDTSAPFLTRDGNERYTGQNWCAHAKIDENEPDRIINSSDDEINSNISDNSCNYRGDINQNGMWDNNDIELFNQCITLKNCDSSISDINYDSKIDSEDVGVLKSYITADYQIGDVNLNGRLDSEDAIIIQKYINGDSSELSELQKKLADVNSDCTINLADGIKLTKKLDLSDSTSDDDDSSSDTGVPNYDKTIYSSDHMCSATNNTVQDYITYRPNSDGILTLKGNGQTKATKVEPLYSFTLTPDNLKTIREYNKKTTYDDFSLECKDSKECVSSFVKTMFTDQSFAKDSSGLCRSSSLKSEFCNVPFVLGLEEK